MIVLTYVRDDVHKTIYPGDTFNLNICDATGCEVMISETVKTEMIITYIASYRFANEDGEVSCPHLAGIFGDADRLPKEILNAVRYQDLPYDKQCNFYRSCGVNSDGVAPPKPSPVRRILKRLSGQ